MQNEAEADELKKREAAILRQQELENYIQEKERQILLLQASAIPTFCSDLNYACVVLSCFVL